MSQGWLITLAKLIAGGCLLVIVLSAAAAALWYIQGGRLLSVQTGSMVPVFRPGDAVIAQRTAFSDLRVGQIISYRSATNGRVIISHRIVTLNPGQGTVITKGDNLTQPDLAVKQSQIIGRVVAVAPGLGRLMNWLRRPIGLSCVVYLPAGYLATVAIYRYLRQPARKRYHHLNA